MKVRQSLFALRGLAALLAVVLATTDAAYAAVELTGGGLELAEQAGGFDLNNLAGVSTGAIPFTSSDLGPELGIGYHVVANINDEIFGNSNSWIGGGTNPYPRPFAGVAFSAPATIASIAFGRDNLKTFTDRTLGLYELQYTTAASPNAATEDASWTTIGTLNYLVADLGGLFSKPSQRHRFNFTPVNDVTGIRLLVPGTGIGGGTAIDEIEVYTDPLTIQPPPPSRVYTPSAGFAITPLGGDGPTVPEDPAPVPGNLALATNGAVPIGSSELGVELGIPFHLIPNVNDGLYGNSNSWISASGDPAPFIGVTLPLVTRIDKIAWGRDNGNTVSDACGGTCTDRSLGVYGLQYTEVVGADGLTPVTGDPTTGWASIGSIEYVGEDIDFTSYLRHEYQLQKDGRGISALSFRLMVPTAGLAGGTAIDELELYKLQFTADANDDGIADFTDLGILLNNYNQPGGFFDGDFDNNGTVEFADLGILLNNYNQSIPLSEQLQFSTSTAPVPEPSSLILAGLGLCGLLAAGRRRRAARG